MRTAPRPRAVVLALCFAALGLTSTVARAQMAGGPSLVRLLGSHATAAFSHRGAPGIGALVSLPADVPAASLGLRPGPAGFGRLYGPPSAIVAFGDAHPELAVEVAPPLHLLLDKATGYVAATAANAEGFDGTGVLIGIADTGLDVTHPDFLDAQGNTRVAWLIDYSQPPKGLHPDLETQFGSSDGAFGAVWAAADINELLRSSASQLPQDEVGHGTLVASCAASNGELGMSPYKGVAPNATLVVARITPAGDSTIDEDDLLSAVGFLFDRATSMGQPMVVNLSLGSDFGPHDGTTSWEQTLASYVGPSRPGRAMVVAAGNSGSIADTPIHQNVFVPPGTKVSVPIATQGAQDGGVQVWVAVHGSASLKVGLDGPDGTWIDLVGTNASAGKNANAYDAAVYNGSQPAMSPVPAQSNGAAVIWQGQWPSGKYAITLSGEGTADLYLEGTGDAASNVGFYDGVREATVDLPATSAGIIGVGCTINKAGWRNVYDMDLSLSVPLLDAQGGEPVPDASAPLTSAMLGEPCWFSGAGPTLGGLAKPEIMAPGAAIVGAMSQQAPPTEELSIFSGENCFAAGAPTNCQQIDAYHAVSFGTSFSSPIVAGAVAILLQRDPTLTQDAIVAALQGGAHPLRGTAPFFADQAGPGEVDVVGSLTVVDRMLVPETALPSPTNSWMSLGADMYLADGSTPLQAILELRGQPAESGGPAPPADGFDASRLQVYALVDGSPSVAPVVTRRGPGVWVATIALPGGLGGSSLKVGATFDGAEVVAPSTIPIAADAWNASYPPSVGGACSLARGPTRGEGWLLASCAMSAAFLGVARRRLNPPSAAEASRESSGRRHAASLPRGRAPV